MVGKNDVRCIIDVRDMSLGEWLDLIETPLIERDHLVEDYRFPTDRHAREYLATVAERSEEDIKNLLRHFLILGGNLGQDRRLLRSWRQDGILGDLLLCLEFPRRLVNPSRDTWEGNTWVLDLLPTYPQMAIDVINAYVTAHVQFLPDGRWDGLIDAVKIIRARYMDFVHPREILLSLSPRDFEYLVALLFQSMGYEVALTKKSRDGGYDVSAHRRQPGEAELLLVECKRQVGNVGVQEVRAVYGVVDGQNATRGILITTAAFTKPAMRFARSTNRLELLDYAALNQLLNKWLGHDWPTRIDGHILDMKRAEVRSETMPAEQAGSERAEPA